MGNNHAMKSDNSGQEVATLATLAAQDQDRAMSHRSKNVGYAGTVATPATLATETRDLVSENRSEGGYVATPATQLEEYLGALAEFSPESLSDSPPRPPFMDPPERGKAWAAWWSAIDRRNRKFKAGRWEPKHRSPALRERVRKCAAHAKTPVHGKELGAGRGNKLQNLNSKPTAAANAPATAQQMEMLI